MQKEWLNAVPQLCILRIVLMCASAVALTMGQMSPQLSHQEKSGLSGPAGTTQVRFWSALSRHRSLWGTKKTDCISPGLAVLVDGRSNRA